MGQITNFDISCVWFEVNVDGQQLLVQQYHSPDGGDPVYNYAHAKSDEELWSILNAQALEDALTYGTGLSYTVVFSADDDGVWRQTDDDETPFHLSDIKRIFMTCLIGEDIVSASYNFETGKVDDAADMKEHPDNIEDVVPDLLEYLAE